MNVNEGRYESPEAYAQRRANETRTPYLITGMGHVWVSCPFNRRQAKDCGGMRAIIRPTVTGSTPEGA